MVRSASLTLDLFFLLCLLAVGITNASVSGRVSYPLAASIPYERFSRRRSLSSRHSNHAHLIPPVAFGGDSSKYVILTSSRTSRKENGSRSSSKSKERKNSPATASPDLEDPIVTYKDLTPLGRAVAGTVEVVVTTLSEYLTGFVGGYVLGTATDIPRLLFRRVDPQARQALLKEMSGRCLRMHTKSFRWARNWGGVSAAFGCFRVAAKVARGGKEDEWTTILSSMAAGAYFARLGMYCTVLSVRVRRLVHERMYSLYCSQIICRRRFDSFNDSRPNTHPLCLFSSLLLEGPQAMVRGAVTYGGLMYLLANLPMNSKAPVPQDYPVDF
jgi:hypothetical protein